MFRAGAMLARNAEGKPPCGAFRGMHETIARDDPSPPRAMPYGSGITIFSLAEECSN